MKKIFQDTGETALHRAVVKENGKSLPAVDFLIQNMSSQGLDKLTAPPNSPDIIGCNSALHLCALYDKPESMKLLLRSGADISLRNSQDKTAFDIAQEMGHHTCQELVS